MKIIFMGTPPVAAQALANLVEHDSVVAVVTQPDRPRGRGLVLSPSPVKVLADRLGLEVLQPVKTRDKSFLERLKAIQPDLIVVVAYGGFLTGEILKIPPLGCVNLHASLLPKYRGAAPIQWAVLNGETETGWTTFYLDEGMDSGDLILQNKVLIGLEEDAGSLFERMIPLGIDLLKETIQCVLEGHAPRTRQDDRQVILAPMLSKADGQIHWDGSALGIVNRVRGLIPWPVAFTFLEWKGKRHELRIFKVRYEPEARSDPGRVIQSDAQGLLVGTGQGGIWIQEVQLEGARRMSAQEFLRGHPISVGTMLG